MSTLKVLKPACFDPSKPAPVLEAKKIEAISSVIKVNSQEVDFGRGISGTTLSGHMDLRLIKKLKKETSISAKIILEDQHKRNRVFGLGTEKQLLHERKITLGTHLSKTQTLRLKVFAKLPELETGHIRGVLRISKTGNPSEFVQIKLRVEALIPKISCPRELSFGEHRVIKASVVQGKTGKTICLPFECHQQLSASVEVSLVGPEDEKISPIVLKTHKVDIKDKQAFMVEMSANYTDIINQKLSNANGTTERPKFEVRKVLVMRIEQTQLHFHFPLIVDYFGKGSVPESE